MDTVQYHQDIQNGDSGAMDTTPILQRPNDLDPSFIPTISSNTLSAPPVGPQMIQQNAPIFPNMTNPASMLSTTMHIPIPDLSQPPSFMSQMEVPPAPHIPPGPPSFLSNLPTLDSYTMAPHIDNTMGLEMNLPLSNSPPGQVPSPSIHGTASSYSAGVTSSLESALDQPGTVRRSRANTSVSPVSAPPSYIGAPSATANLSFLPTETSIVMQEDTPKAEAETVVAVESILERRHARTMIHHRHDLETGSSIDILHQKINEAAQQFSELLVITSSSTPYPTLQSPGISVQEHENPLDFTPPPVPPASTHMDIALPDNLAVAEHPRKRCASELEETRNVKAPKREPQDDVNLHTPPAVPATSFFGISPVLVKPQTSSSRPPTPPTTFSPHGPFSPIKSITPFPLSAPPIPKADFTPNLNTPLTVVPSTFPGMHTSWSDSVVPTRHRHSLSSGSLGGNVVPSTPPAATSGMVDPFTSMPMQQTSLSAIAPAIAATISPPIGRMSRSGSINGTYPSSWFMETSGGNWPNTLGSRTAIKGPAQTAPSTWFPNLDNQISVPSLSPTSSTASDRLPPTGASTTQNSPVEDDDDDDEDDDDDNDSSVSKMDAADAKGEPIHQRLMAKKMQRLDESLDFRPFKFRIQAFTMAFLEELASRGYPEEKIPMKKIRNYLWRQQYILRFNEDGKKAKSKGNHIWNIEAKRIGDGKWEFRPFHRKLAGSPPPVAYAGLKWSWTPHVWDPQASWQNVPVEYSSPSLPSWLSWKEDILSGVPPSDAESCRITVNAKYTLDGQEGQLSHTFQIAIAPVDSIEAATSARSRRPSLAGDPPKRSTSDSVLVQGVPRPLFTYYRAKPRPLPSRRPSPESADTRVIRVLQSVAQRVTQEAQSQISQSPPKHLQELAKQKQVLEHSVTAYDKAITRTGDNPQQNRLLAVAAQNVVVQAAHQVIADRTVANGGIPQQQSETVAIKSVTVMELSDATQGAIAAAVKQKGRDSTEVDIMVAATSILKSRTSTAEPATVIQQSSHSASVIPRIPNHPTYSLPPVSEYA
ncbi:hypothetical protein DXG01_016309 [Tephrocybe rancida]|nr:hypothetical protein DXG01_016309 [Tephrocybe rancida]